MLITCPECAASVSDQARACPHCGRPISAPKGSLAALHAWMPRFFGYSPFTLGFWVIYVLVEVLGYLVLRSINRRATR
jgi:hypothetical protein